MNERKRKRKLPNEAQNNTTDPWKPTDDETQVANHLYRKLPAAEGRLSGMVVRTFSATDALDMLMESPWAKVPNLSGELGGKSGRKPRLFNGPPAVVDFMNQMLVKQMFHRALAVKKSKSSASKRSEDGKSTKSKRSAEIKTAATTELSTPNEDNSATLPGSSAPGDSSPAAAATVDTETADTSRSSSAASTSSSKSANRPRRLELHPEQVFLTTDPESVYVWIYEPPPGLFNWIAGSLLIVGIIFCCLFPVWPASLRLGTYYLTLCASGLFGLLMAMALIRVMLYTGCWLATLGGYSMWLFPNYFADCGFFESFRPIVSLTPIVSGSRKSRTAGSRKSSRLKNVNAEHKPEETAKLSSDGVDNGLVRRRNLDQNETSRLKKVNNDAAAVNTALVSSEDEPEEVTVSNSENVDKEIFEMVHRGPAGDHEEITEPLTSDFCVLETAS